MFAVMLFSTVLSSTCLSRDSGPECRRRPKLVRNQSETENLADLVEKLEAGRRLLKPAGMPIARAGLSIPFSVKFGSIRETIETVPEDQKVLATSINTG
jgi:hypothetical protein